jgi:hypothetical protein
MGFCGIGVDGVAGLPGLVDDFILATLPLRFDFIFDSLLSLDM